MAESKTIEVPDGFTLFPYFVKNEDVEVTITTLASYVAVKFEPVLDAEGEEVKDDDGAVVMAEKYTDAVRAKIFLQQYIDGLVKRFRSKKVISDARIKGVTIQ